MSDELEQGTNLEEENQSPMPSEEAQDLPDNASDRTREEFEKLKKHNQELKEQLERQSRASTPSVLDSLNPSVPDAKAFNNLNQSQVESIQESFTTKGDDGYEYVDVKKLNEALRKADERAKRAEEQAKQAQQQFERFEEKQQTKVAYSEFPQLDPNSDKFDRKFYENVRDKLIAQAYRGEKDLLKAASEVKDLMGEPKAKPEVDKKQTQKQVIASQTSARAGDWDNLVQATRKGQSGAIAERLRRSGY